ncbi:MAG TPA: ATP-dependent RecD-like DNA helicase [Actinobacteria bacterium]|nr:ATP-dependent RecD-like DNA helicase [Actinomycetota bacterium]
MEGKWIVNKTYGKQFEIAAVKAHSPATMQGIENYLGSGMIKGVGPAMAARIVSCFKEKTLEILDDDPEKLSEIEGIGKKRIKQIVESWNKHRNIRNIMIFLQSYGISGTYAMKIYNTYGDNAENVIKVNPYRLAEDIFGIGFKIADDIAIKSGIARDSIFRIKSGIIYLLRRAEDSGHCFLPYDNIIDRALDFLETGQSLIDNAIEDLERDEKIVIVDSGAVKKIYLKSLYISEQYVREKILELINMPNDGSGRKRREDLYKRSISELSDANNIELDGIQIEAITKALMEKMIIITGSPGTGKSTILNFIIKMLERENKKVLMAAPTGRASKRMTETTGRESKTIHRLLSFNPKLNKFLKNEENPINADVIVIDEASMLDIRLTRNLLAAVRKNTRLVFVGDIDQLPPVGPGYVLGDLIKSGVVPVSELKKIYRQEGESQIIRNAHRVRDGKYPNIERSEVEDFYFIEKNDPEGAVELILHLLTKKISSSFNMDPLTDVQVLVPTNRGICGVYNLNSRIQEAINPGNGGLLQGGRQFKTGDRIIQLKNNYEKEIFNGDIGIIKNINIELKEVNIDFDGKTTGYSFYELDEISHSYAISIHKSQGSEFRCVIIPLLTSHYMLLQRNLLYTALTRARELAILIGSKKAIGMAISKNVVEKRFTGLKELLQDI